MNNIVIITANSNGEILSISNNRDSTFGGYKNLNEIAGLSENLKLITINPLNKKYLVNLFKKNYTVVCIATQLMGMEVFQYIFEEWKLISPIGILEKSELSNFHDRKLTDISIFTANEQEIIFCLLFGYIQDKEILSLLSNMNGVVKSANTIKYTVSLLLDRFGTSSRTSLCRLLKSHGLDSYLPITLFVPGIYHTSPVKLIH